MLLASFAGQTGGKEEVEVRVTLSLVSIVVCVAAMAWPAAAQVPTAAPTPRPGLSGAAAKDAVKCEKGISKIAGTFVGQKRANLKKCLDTVFTCIQLKPDDFAACLGKARVTCDGRFAKIAAAETKMLAAIPAACSSPTLTSGLLTEAGLGFGSPELLRRCADFGVQTIDDAADVASCLVRHHTCVVADLFAVENPLASYLLGLVDRSLPSAFCPVPSPAAATPTPTSTPSATATPTPTETPIPTATATPQPSVLFTVVNTGPGGSFGNRTTTSATCAAAAVTQQLSCSATVALLAYTNDDLTGFPVQHGVPASVPVIAAGSSATIADSWSDFLDGSWDTCLGSFCDPSGPTAAGLGGQFFLTGAHNDGTVDASSNCSDWSSTTGTFSAAGDNCYGSGSVGPGFCAAGETLAGTFCNDPACCNVTQGAMLCLCY